MVNQKYNRTPHLPWSKGTTNDDKIMTNVNSLLNLELVITEKMDGSNASLERNGCFARTHSGPPTHPSFDLMKALHSSIRYKIPESLQLFGENVYAKHSIEYSELPGYFLLFNVRNLKTLEWSSWNEVEMWAREIEVPTVPVLYSGRVTTEKELQTLTKSFMDKPSCCGGIREGVVVRVREGFMDDLFPLFCAKNVRECHVQTSEHWKDQEIVKNKLRVV